jgi:hypothetical protein
MKGAQLREGIACRDPFMIIGIGMLSMCIICEKAYSSDSSIERTREQLLQGWQKLSNLDRERKCYKARLVESSDSGTVVFESKASIDIADSDRINAIYSRDEGELLYCQNSRYALLATRSVAGRGAWRLGRFGEFATGINEPFEESRSLANIPYLFPLSVFMGRLPEELSQPGQLLLHSSRPIADSRLELAFTHSRVSKNSTQQTTATSGTMIVDPTRHFVVLDMVLNLPDNKSSHLTRDVSEVGGRLVCAKYAFTRVNRSIEEFTFSDYVFNSPVDDKVYYLSNYGLPEPQGETRQDLGGKWYFWIGFAAVCFGVVAVVFHRLARRS